MKISGQRYHNEILTPKQNTEDIEKDLEKFAINYQTSLDNDFSVCIPDNPLGRLSFEAIETIETTEVPIIPDRLMIHLNTFHRKQDLDRILKALADNGIANILAVSGDGTERLHRLSPEEVGFDVTSVTSVELIKYIKREFPDTFNFGVAFNHYEPQESEREKLHRKIDAGAEYIVTQPIIKQSENIDWLKTMSIPIIVGAWMSKRIDLVAECIGYDLPKEEKQSYDGIENLKCLRKNYPDFGVYLSFLGMKKQIFRLEEAENN